MQQFDRHISHAQKCWACLPPQVLRIDTAGRTRRIYVKRRDLLRANGLQPRDLRRIDPSQSLTKTSPNITVKEAVLLTNLGGVRCVGHLLASVVWCGGHDGVVKPASSGMQAMGREACNRRLALLGIHYGWPAVIDDIAKPACACAHEISELEHALLPRRTIVRADKCLLFEPNSPCSRKFLDIVCPRLQDHETARRARAQRLLHHHGGLEVVAFPEDEEKAPPFELEILEAALMVATGGVRRCWTATSAAGPL